MDVHDMDVHDMDVHDMDVHDMYYCHFWQHEVQVEDLFKEISCLHSFVHETVNTSAMWVYACNIDIPVGCQYNGHLKHNTNTVLTLIMSFKFTDF
jgi:hypothetical protein